MLAEHAAGLRDGDGARLDRAATAAAAIGANAVAILAFADASWAHHDEVAANRAATRAALWQRATPVTDVLSRPARAALTGRELDAAALALEGDAGRRIAERLFVSVRTVDNHLAHVYRKLGVGGRDALRRALRPVPAP